MVAFIGKGIAESLINFLSLDLVRIDKEAEDWIWRLGSLLLFFEQKEITKMNDKSVTFIFRISQGWVIGLKLCHVF